MDKSNKISKAFSELANELGGLNDVVESLKELRQTIIDSNEEMMATFVEGTKRIIKSPKKDGTDNDIAKKVVLGINEVVRVSSEVEKGVKAIKMPSNVDFRATGTMLKFPIKELTRAIRDFDMSLPRGAKDPISVRLSDGEKFYKALETFVTQIGGGGATSYAFDTQGGSPTKAATTKITVDDKERDVLMTVPARGVGAYEVNKYYTNAGAVTDGIVWSPDSGKRWYITDIFIGVSANSTITLEDDQTGGDVVKWKHEVYANSGWTHSFSTPLFSGQDGADLIITSTAGNIYVTVTGYEI